MSKYNVRLKTPLLQGISLRYKKIGYNIDFLRQTACLVVDPIKANSFAYLFNCTTAGWASNYFWGWSGGAKELGKLPVPGRPTDLDYSRARADCACGRCGWGLFGYFFSHLSLIFSVSLSLGDGPI